MSAIDTALSTIDQVASEGDLAPARLADLLELGSLTEPIVLPDGKRIYPPRLHGEPIDELACALIDTDRPAESTFLRLIGPPGSGKSQIARAVAYRLWRNRSREVEGRHGVPFYGFVEITGGPSIYEYLFRHEFVPAAGDAGTVRLVDSAFVQLNISQQNVAVGAFGVLGYQDPAGPVHGRLSWNATGVTVNNSIDSNTYLAERLTVSSAGQQTINAVAPAVITGLSATLGIGVYHITGCVTYTCNQAGGTPTLLVAGQNFSGNMSSNSE